MRVTIITNHFEDCHAVYLNNKLIQEFWDCAMIDYRWLGQNFPTLRIPDIEYKQITLDCSNYLEQDKNWPDQMDGLEFEKC